MTAREDPDEGESASRRPRWYTARREADRAAKRGRPIHLHLVTHEEERMKRRVMMSVAAMGLLGCSLFSQSGVKVGGMESEAEEPAEATQAPMAELPGGGDAACLVGTWTVTDVSAMLEGMIPTGVDSSSMQFEGTSGTMQVTFAENGTGEYALDQFSVSYSMMGMPMSVALNGGGVFTYQVSGDQLTMLTGEGASMTGELTIGDSTSPLGDLGEGFVSGTQAFACEGDTLALTPDVANASPILYERVSR
jgi:hypothetical protein